jgi:hypothetical protein
MRPRRSPYLSLKMQTKKRKMSLFCNSRLESDTSISQAGLKAGALSGSDTFEQKQFLEGDDIAKGEKNASQT